MFQVYIVMVYAVMACSGTNVAGTLAEGEAGPLENEHVNVLTEPDGPPLPARLDAAASIAALQCVARMPNGHNCVGHNQIGHNCIDHNCIVDTYIGAWRECRTAKSIWKHLASQ